MTSPFLDDRVVDHANKNPDAQAIGAPSGWGSYADLSAAIRDLAGSLRARGVGRRSFVLNALPNGAASVAASLAIQRVGGCPVEINPAWGDEFIARIARSTDAHYAFAQPREAVSFQKFDTSWCAIWVVNGTALRSNAKGHGAAEIVPLDRSGRPEEPAQETAPEPRSLDDLALLLFTSATTSEPRGVMLSYRNVAANTEAIVQYLELTSADRVMSILPLSYSYGRSLLQTHLWIGGSIFFDHRFMYPRVVLEAIAAERCSGFAGVPLTFEVLRRQCDPRDLPPLNLRYVTQAGGGMSSDLRLWVRDAFSPARFYVMYGQTEATARLAYLPPERLDEKPAAIGIPIPGVSLRVVDDDGRDMADNEVGNLVAQGENVTTGYLNAPDETREILKGGWLWTGDLARRDADGFFFLAGRTRTMLKVSGHRFSPEQVEERLSQHPAVREACAVGAPDPITGEAVCAFVVLDQAVEAQVLRRHCAEALPPFKVPKRVIVLESLPRSSAGKVRRADLEARARSSAGESTDE